VTHLGRLLLPGTDLKRVVLGGSLEAKLVQDTGWKPMLHCSFASPTLTGRDSRPWVNIIEARPLPS